MMESLTETTKQMKKGIRWDTFPAIESVLHWEIPSGAMMGLQ